MEQSSTFKKIVKERQEAVSSLRESEEKCRVILEEMQDAYFEVDLDGNFTFVNKALCHALGYSHEELIGMNYHSIVLADAATNLYKAFNAVYREAQPRAIIAYKAVRKNGSMGDVEVMVSPIKNRLGEVVGFRCLGRDITERKQAEEALRESEEKFRFLANNTHDILWTMDLNMHTTYVSPSVESALGFTPEERMKQNVKEQLTPASLSIAQDTLARELDYEQSGQAEPDRVVIIESEYYHKDGSTLWFENAMTSIRNDKGILTGLQGVSRNIMERKQAEEALKKSEEKYRLLAEHTTDFIWLMDMTLKNMYVSPSVLKRTGFTEQEMIEMPYEQHMSPDSLKVAAKVVEEYIPKLEADPKYNPISKFDIEYCCKDGTTFWTENTFSLIRDENGKPASILGEAREITERKIAEEKLVKSYESLKRTLNDAIATMVKIVEMRDPYTAGHQQKVADLATAIAKEMKLDDTRIDQLRMAAVIHDVGKMYVPSDILSKPGKLAKMELDLIKTHAQGGYDIVKSMDFPCSIANTVLQHHERLDGSGYPKGLKGEDTLLEAKILAVADVIEAMASHRPYRPALGIDIALEEISKNRGKLYDPDVVDACLELFNSGRFVFKSV
jgi:PAS domain S-box-containing protein/putative nucleotidyltransferase with HDIG domain